MVFEGLHYGCSRGAFRRVQGCIMGCSGARYGGSRVHYGGPRGALRRVQGALWRVQVFIKEGPLCIMEGPGMH